MTNINIRELSHSEMDLYRKPLLPETWSCFPVDEEVDTQTLRRALQKDLDKIRSGAEKDPFSNSITMLALDISRRLEKKKLNYSALEALIQRLAVGSLGFRADRLRKYIGELDKEKNNSKIKNLILNLSKDKDGKTIDFEIFQKKIEKNIFGIVLTAHPTFGNSFNMIESLANMATMTNVKGKDINIHKLKILIKNIFKTEQRPDKEITLDYEHGLSIYALKNLQIALKDFYKQVLLVSKKIYPKQYQKLVPKIFSLHTWVGYDVDGRGDISWIDTFCKRLKVKLEQLDIYQKSFIKISKKIKEKNCRKISEIINKIFSKGLNLTNTIHDRLDKKGLINDINEIKKISKFMYDKKHKSLIDLTLVSREIKKLYDSIKKSKIRNKENLLLELQIFNTELQNYGLGLGRTQVRLNANQLNNAIAKEIDLHGAPDDPSNKTTYLNMISKLMKKLSQ